MYKTMSTDQVLFGDHMSQSLNSSKGVYMGEYSRVFKGNTRNLDCRL